MTYKLYFFVFISRHGSTTHISINESALVRDLTLFSIIAVDNHHLAQIIES